MVSGISIPLFSVVILFPVIGVLISYINKSQVFLYGSLILSNLALVFISYMVYLYNPIDGIVPIIGFLANWIFIDGVNLSLLWSTGVIFSAITVYSFASNVFSIKLYFQLLLFLEYLIIIALLSNHIVVFYLLYEALAIPMFFLIGLVGVRGRKLHAAYLFLFFTFFCLGVLITLFFSLFFRNDFLEFEMDGRTFWTSKLAVNSFFFVSFFCFFI